MQTPFKAAKVTESVYWVGAIDWGIRNFHGYQTSRGTTYNAFLVLADKVTLIDTVKAPFRDEMLSRIASVMDPKDIRYIVSDHSEMDHTGALPDTINIIEPEKVFASNMGAKALSEHFQLSQEITAVQDGEQVALGNMNLTFVETRMLHWPDSMFSYLSEEDILFSQDGFGMHLATLERFDDEIDDEVLEYEAAKYYANILLPYSPLVAKIPAKLEQMGIRPTVIAPDHGPIWRKDLTKIVKLYGKWAAQQPGNKAVVVYDTMWQSTDLMARAVADGLSQGGSQVKLMPLQSCHRSDVATELLGAGAIVVGSPTLNSNMFPTVADVLTYLRGLKPQNLVGAAFGSYGWNEAATRQIEEVLTSMKVELVSKAVTVKYVPNGDDLMRCYDLGIQIAEALKGRIHQQ
jgi:flavorubredoxin